MRIALVLCLIGFSFVVSVSAVPPHVYTTPTYDYGPSPLVFNNVTGALIDCSWYGWDNYLFPREAKNCSLIMRAIFLDPELFPRSERKAFIYYYYSRLSDPITKDPYCYQGCFDLTGSTSPPGAPPPSVLYPSPPPTTPDTGIPPPPPRAPPPSLVDPPTPPPPGVVTPTTPSPGQVAPTTPSTPIFNPNNAGLLRPSALGSWLVLAAGAAMLMMTVRW